MSERLKRQVAGTILAGCGALGLSACSSGHVTNGRWVVGMECGPNLTPKVTSIIDGTDQALISATCLDSNNTQHAPTSIELLEGRGTTITGSQTKDLSKLAIGYTWRTGADDLSGTSNDDPTIDLATTKTGAEIQILSVQHLTSVGFGNQSTPIPSASA